MIIRRDDHERQLAANSVPVTAQGGRMRLSIFQRLLNPDLFILT
jgi:hypothetical protein